MRVQLLNENGTQERLLQVDFKHEWINGVFNNAPAHARPDHKREMELEFIIETVSPQTDYDSVNVVTTAIIRDSDNDGDSLTDVCRGYAFCNYQDQFVKATGRKIALKRALEESGLTKQERAQVWEAYNNRNSKDTALVRFYADGFSGSLAGLKIINGYVASNG